MRAVLIFGALVASVHPVGLAADVVVKVAVVHGTYDNNRHQGEHDGALAQLGWPFTKYPMTDLKRLTGELDQYDLVLANPLFNYGDVQDYGAYADQWRAFMKSGGAIVLTDCNYLPCVDWLAKIGETFKASTEGCKAEAPAAEASPGHPLHFFPNELEGHNTWAHLTLNGNGWEVISRCGDRHPIAAVHRLGKGFLFITSLWPLRAADLENVWANLNLQRLGFAATQFQMPKFIVGPSELRLGLKRLADSPATTSLSFEATPQAGAPMRFTREETFVPGQERAVRLPYRLGVRGETAVRLRLAVGSEAATLLERRALLPQLLNVRVRAPVYRGLVPVSRWAGKVLIGIDIVPDKEDIKRLSLRVQVLDAAGRQRAQQIQKRLSAPRFDLPVSPEKVSPGQYTVRAELAEGDRTLARQEVTFTVLEDLPSQVVIDDNLSTIVNGKPFFPIGIYHVGLGDLPQVAALGMNAVQGWGGNVEKAREFLDTAQRNGLMVLLEMGGLVGETVNAAAIEEHVRALKDHPALLVWYVRDEPSPAHHETVLQATELFHRLDQNHPTYIVSCIPNEFGSQAQLADILAVDPYPMPSGPVSTVANWADLAWKATKGEKPVWLIPQTHDGTSYNVQPPARGANPPTPAQVRCMTYLSLVHGAKGLIWYTWDDGPNMGVKYHPTLQAEIKKVCSEVRALTPALLSGTKRQFTASDGKVHGLVCGQGNDRSLLLVNVIDQPLEAVLDVPEAKGVQNLTPVFGEGTARLEGKQLSLRLEPYEVKVFRLGRADL